LVIIYITSKQLLTILQINKPKYVHRVEQSKVLQTAVHWYVRRYVYTFSARHVPTYTDASTTTTSFFGAGERSTAILFSTLHPDRPRHRAATSSSTAMRRSWRPSPSHRAHHLHRRYPVAAAPFAATRSGQCCIRTRLPPPQRAGTAPAARCQGTRRRRCRPSPPGPSPWPRRKRMLSPCLRACSCGRHRRARRVACRPRSSAGGTPCRGTAAVSGCSCCSSRTWCCWSRTAGTAAAAGAAGAGACFPTTRRSRPRPRRQS
jgi:hypothetical protein